MEAVARVRVDLRTKARHKAAKARGVARLKAVSPKGDKGHPVRVKGDRAKEARAARVKVALGVVRGVVREAGKGARAMAVRVAGRIQTMAVRVETSGPVVAAKRSAATRAASAVGPGCRLVVEAAAVEAAVNLTIRHSTISHCPVMRNLNAKQRSSRRSPRPARPRARMRSTSRSFSGWTSTSCTRSRPKRV